MTPDDPILSDCGCCEGVEPLTPRDLTNNPGQDTLAYRVGTHGAFKASMLARLAVQQSLRGLTTRRDDDPAIGLIDSWATTLDVLAFYQERIANEGFLRTAVERRSVLELARAIGYELRPGVAASTFLAFTLDNFPGGPTEAVIPVGTKAQSVPGQDEKPQLFETVEEIDAKAAWNAIPARQSVPFIPPKGGSSLYLQGANLNLKPGDALLIIDLAIEGDKWNGNRENWDFRPLTKVVEVPDKNGTPTLTYVEWSPLSYYTPAAGANIYVFRQRASVFGYNAPDWRLFSDEARKHFPVPPPGYTGTDWPYLVIYTPKHQRHKHLIAAGVQAAGKAVVIPSDSDLYLLDTIDLDQIYPKILNGSWLVLSEPSYVELYQIKETNEAARTDFGLTSKTSRVKLDGGHLVIFRDLVRSTVVYAEPELLKIAPQPLTTWVEQDTVWLDALVPTLAPGRLIAITGEDASTQQIASEIREVKTTSVVQGTTFITLTKALSRQFKRSTVVVNANVAAATHGETKQETLGSGDGAKEFQSFSLKFKPVTHISSASAGGAESTVEIRVDNILWKEAPSFYQLGPGERRYIERVRNDGTVSITFGDGTTGARLPSGSQNVTAQYRTGQGLEGMVKAGQISLLLSRPLGVGGVVNPTAPVGGGDPELIDDARRNAPLPILTLDRIVSVQDYEDFSRAFAGVGKAQATLLWNGGQQLVHLTLAAADGGAFPEDSDPFANLLAAIDLARHPAHRVVANSYTPLQFQLSAEVLVNSDYVSDDVLAAARKELTDVFSAPKRDLGQGVNASEILSILQGVPGVDAANILSLHFVGEAPPPLPILPAPSAHWDGTNIVPGALLSLDTTTLNLTEMTL